MAQTIKIKRTTGSGKPTSVAQGELFYAYGTGGTYGKRLSIGNSAGGGNTPEIIGGSYYTNIIDTAASANTASKLVLRDASGDFAAGTITASLTGNVTGNVSGTAATVTGAAQTAITSVGTLTALQVDNLNLDGTTVTSSAALNLTPGAGSAIVLDGTISVDAGVVTGATSITSTAFVGALTGNAATATKWATARNLSLTGDATATFSSVDGTAAVSTAITFATVNSNVGTFGSTTAIPVVTVNGKGLVTAVSTAALSTSFTISADSGSDDTFNNGGTLTFTGGQGIDTTVSNDTITIAAELATETNAGVATFDGTDFTVSSGDVTLNAERVQDIVGAMVSSNTESGIAVTYDDSDGTLDFDVVDPTLSFTGDVTGSGTMTNLGSTSIALTVAANSVALGTDTTGSYVESLVAGTGISLANNSGEGATPTISIGQAVATTSNVTFNNVTVDGVLNSDDITASTMTASGNVVVQGNLVVNGTTTTVNSNTVNIGDAILSLNSDLANDTAPSENAGIAVYRGSGTGAGAEVSLIWNETSDFWQLTEDGSSFSKIMTAGNFASSFTGILDGGTY
tara:strand:+ start:2887 stop:4599 length:1713 start_codon:yes stop_codon:yes gene_type:complete